METAVPETRPAVDIRHLTATKETIAYADGGIFPVLAITADRTIVAVVRGGAGHLGLGGRVEIVRSIDGGESWSPPIVVADSDWDDREFALGVSASDTLVLTYQRQGGYHADGTYFRPEHFGEQLPMQVMVTRSHDAGLTWESPGPISHDVFCTAAPYGKIITLADTTLVAPMYIYDYSDPGTQGVKRQRSTETPPGSYLIRSDDNGLTWDDPSLIAPGMNETAILMLADDTMLAVMRRTDHDAALWSAHSHDRGWTWTDPVQITRSRQHPGDLLQLASGDLLLLYGNRNPPYRVEGRASRDGGKTWLDSLITVSGHLYGANVEAARVTDFGYPSSVIHRCPGQARGVTVYYMNTSIPKDLDWGVSGPQSPFYRDQGYRAVAVTWDEAELITAIKQMEGNQ